MDSISNNTTLKLIMKNKPWLLLVLILSFNSTFVHATSVVNPLNPPAQPRVVAELTHKNGMTYEFREKYNLYQGANTYTYDFGSNEEGYKILYKGENFGDSNQCPKNDVLGRFGNPEIALIKHNFYQRDFNQDGIDDIDLSLATQNCKSGKIIFFEILILSKKDGFDFKHYNIGDNNEK